jgi:hypothetical protein
MSGAGLAPAYNCRRHMPAVETTFGAHVLNSIP